MLAAVGMSPAGPSLSMLTMSVPAMRTGANMSKLDAGAA